MAFPGRPPQPHAIERGQQVVEGVVPLGGSDHQGEGPLDDEGGEPGVKALVSLGVGEKEAAESVQAPLERGENQRRSFIKRIQSRGKDPGDSLGQNVNNSKGTPHGSEGGHKFGKGASRGLTGSGREEGGGGRRSGW